MKGRSYQDLIAWQRGMALASAVYRLPRSWPREEAFGLTCQIRRAAVSIPTNIAEGQARGTAAEFRRFLRIAIGSVAEVETQLLIAQDLAYSPEAAITELLDQAAESGRLIAGLIRSLPQDTN
jgi:four helix bundle protein